MVIEMIVFKKADVTLGNTCFLKHKLEFCKIANEICIEEPVLEFQATLVGK